MFVSNSQVIGCEDRPDEMTYTVSGGALNSVVVSGVGLINEVNRHWARLVLGWVTVCGRVIHFGM